MFRFLISLIVGLLVGVGVGVFLGWGPFPVEFVNSPASDLAQPFQDDFTVMIANGFQADSDLDSALERLRLLETGNIPEYVQGVTERYISASRDIDDIRSLVTLSEALGRLTPIMEPYRQVNSLSVESGL